MPANASSKIEKQFNRVGKDVFVVKVIQEHEHVYTKEEARIILNRLKDKKQILENQVSVIDKEIADFEQMLKS